MDRAEADRRDEDIQRVVALEQIEAFSTLGPSFFFTVPFFSMLSTRYGFIIFPLLAMAL